MAKKLTRRSFLKATLATAGTIGNASNKITIGSDTTNGYSYIYKGMSSLGSSENGFYLGTNGIALGGGKFKVTDTGVLTATSATITGAINATSGTIGNASNKISIGSDTTNGYSYIYSGMTSLASTASGFYIGTNGISFGGGKFKVTADGAVTASTLTLTKSQVDGLTTDLNSLKAMYGTSSTAAAT